MTSQIPLVDSTTGMLPDAVMAALRGVFPRRGDVPAELIAAGGVNPFNTQMATYNWKPSNTLRFRTALGKAMAGVDRCNIVAAGESTTAGRGLASTEVAYPAFMRRALAAQGIPLTGNGAVHPGRGDVLVVDGFTTMGSGWTPVGQQLYTTCNTVGATLTITGAGTSLTLLSSNYGSGTFSYSIDGGAAVNVANSGASTIRTTTITGLTAGNHTVVITLVSGTVNFYSAEFAAATGVSVSNCGSSGSTVGTYWGTGQFFNDLGAVLAHNPHLTLFGMQINDLAQSTSVAAYKTAMLATVSALEAAGDVAICTSNAASGSWSPSQWSAFNTVLYQIADQLDIPLIDVSFRAPSYPVNNSAGLMIDTYHPTASFYSERGSHHARVLLSV